MNSRICQLHLKELISTFLANILYLLAIDIFVIKIAFIKHLLSVAKVLKFDIYLFIRYLQLYKIQNI